MKKYIPYLALLLLVSVGSCKKDKEKILPRFPAPSWKKDNTGKYPLSMTAVVRLPYELQAGSQQGDELAAFISGECRGTGETVKVGDTQVFFVLIQGTATEQGKVIFKYYSAKSSYMYTSGVSVQFSVDGNYGTADKPITLDLRPAE